MRIKWRCDIGCIVDKNWIPGGTEEAVGTGQLHGVAARAPILGRWFITYTSWMRIKWRCDIGCIIDKNWIPSGTEEAVGTGQLHGVAARAPILGRWFITLFCNY
jgi:hypothetical protein